MSQLQWQSKDVVQILGASAGNPDVYVQKETQYAWECIQKECQKVLSILLQGQAGPNTAAPQSDRLGGCAQSDAAESLPASKVNSAPSVTGRIHSV